MYTLIFVNTIHIFYYYYLANERILLHNFLNLKERNNMSQGNRKVLKNLLAKSKVFDSSAFSSAVLHTFHLSKITKSSIKSLVST